MKTTRQEIIVGLDLGNYQIRVAIGARREEGIEIIGVGQSQSSGMRKGQVVNCETSASAIRKAVSQAERMAGCMVSSVVVGTSDWTICSHISHGSVRIKQGIVSEQDIRRVMQSTRKIHLPRNHEIMHTLPCEYLIDNQTRTGQPLGMTGSTLEVTAHIITLASDSIKSIVKACKMAGLKELTIVLQSLATAETMLLSEERQQGVVHIDFGAGPAKIAAYSNNSLSFYNRSWLSGHQITEFMAIYLRILMAQAEQVKCRHGCCHESVINRDVTIEIEQKNDQGKKLIPHQTIFDITVENMEAMFSLISSELQKSGLTGKLVAGAVITGGSSLMPGMEELAKKMLKMPVRIGSPRTIEGLVDTVSPPQHSTAVGLVLFRARADGFPQAIRVGEGDSLMIRATQAIRHLLRKFA